MKIGLVLPALPAYSETFFRNKILGLQKQGHQVVLFVTTTKNDAAYFDCKVVKAPQLSGNSIKVLFVIMQQLFFAVFNFQKSYYLFQLNKKDKIPFVQNIKQVVSNQFLLKESFDWLHFGFGTMALGRENVAKVIQAKMAVSFRGFDYYVYPLKNKDCYKILFKKEVNYHVLSNAMKKGLIGQSIPENKIFKITPAIDIELFTQNEKENVNEKLHFSTISRLHYIKGLDYILEALSLLKKVGFDFHFTIVGDGAEKERLQFAAHQLGITDNVTFAGKLSPEKVKSALNETDIYLQYSSQEGFCNAVLEAQAMGLLCVVSNAEGLSENVLDKETGFVVEKQNSKLLFEKLKEVVALPEIEKQQIRQKAIERVRKDFNLDKQQQEFLAFYSKNNL